MPTEPAVCSQSVTCILTQAHRVTPQSMIRGGQVSGHLTFTATDDVWYREDRLQLSKPSHAQVGNGTKKTHLAWQKVVNMVVLSD